MLSIAYLARSLVIFSWFVPAAVIAAESGAVDSQSYPSKPIRLVNPFAVGGAGDIMARIIGQKITEHWRQQVVVA
jgi:tripartite-type tricarboxylate transporter receptor subunit TctC